mgnify:FL=1
MNMNEKKDAFIAKIAEKGSAAQETEIAAMVNLGNASSRQEALEMIKAHPGEDFADIAGSVLHGIPFQDALDETDFTRVKEASATDILGWLDNIHTAWVLANISPKRLVQELCKDQLSQYRSMANISWNEILKYYLFIEQYVIKSGNPVTKNDLLVAFWSWRKANRKKPDFDREVDSQFMACAPQIVSALEAYRDNLDPNKSAELVQEINYFLSRHNSDGVSIMMELIAAK